tara:strand:+ start:230 stop:547 length:318 start_codon:yes stop_codon:yes gene_type:complete
MEMNLSNEAIIEIASDWWGISRPNCDEDRMRDILRDGSLRSDLAEQLPTPWDDPDESPDSEDIECVARVIEQLVECHLDGDEPDIGEQNAVINFTRTYYQSVDQI